ncbi:hypothetical protein [Arthrobacter sp. HLT1-21]
MTIANEDLNFWNYNGPMTGVRNSRTVECAPLADADAAHIGFEAESAVITVVV